MYTAQKKGYRRRPWRVTIAKRKTPHRLGKSVDSVDTAGLAAVNAAPGFV